jgi:nucleotide-binding universal stress UspA family protein
MATHGRTGFDHLLYGSVTEAVLAASEVPVFAVYARPGEAPPPPFSPETARVVVPQDGSAYDAPALAAALDMLGARGEITLVSVVKPPTAVELDENGRVLAYLDQQEEAHRLEARDYLTNIAAQLRSRARTIEVRVDVRVGDPTSGIAMAAIDATADLIVMATHGRTGIRRALLGSVAGTVLRTGYTPVLLVHPQHIDVAGASTRGAER